MNQIVLFSYLTSSSTNLTRVPFSQTFQPPFITLFPKLPLPFTHKTIPPHPASPVSFQMSLNFHILDSFVTSSIHFQADYPSSSNYTNIRQELIMLPKKKMSKSGDKVTNSVFSRPGRRLCDGKEIAKSNKRKVSQIWSQ